MKKICDISFLEIESIPKPIKDFLSGQLTDFQEDLFSIENFQSKIQAKKNYFTLQQREILEEVLQKQCADFNLSEKQKKNLESLKNANCFTVTTGHQLNLFTGPVFFIYKILQTIKTAEFLKRHFPECDFVPIFWMASEDHDLEEISHFKTDSDYYEIQEKSGGGVGRIKVNDQTFIDQFEKEFENSVFGSELISWLREAYHCGNTLSQATRVLGQKLFSEYGLLMLDGDEVSLKSQMITVFKDELQSQQLKKQTEKNVEYLNEHYGKVQVNPREINLFYLTETRNRIDFDGQNYFIIDTPAKFSPEEMFAELESHPERFSPNALMRPVYQETVLPNIAYIGGNAEVMYWLELKDYFQSLKLVFPVLIPRNSMLFISEKITAKMEKLDIQPHELLGDFSKLIKKRLLQDHELLQLLSENENMIKTSFERLKDRASLTDRSFRNLVEAEETRQLKSYRRMEKRLLRAERMQQKDRVTRMNRLYHEIHPGGIWQERVYNFSVFYSQDGKHWIDFCYDNMDVENSKLIMMQV